MIAIIETLRARRFIKSQMEDAAEAVTRSKALFEKLQQRYMSSGVELNALAAAFPDAFARDVAQDAKEHHGGT